jgi:hypothetical protein
MMYICLTQSNPSRFLTRIGSVTRLVMVVLAGLIIGTAYMHANLTTTAGAQVMLHVAGRHVGTWVAWLLCKH